jgi:hypothetical protein
MEPESIFAWVSMTVFGLSVFAWVMLSNKKKHKPAH